MQEKYLNFDKLGIVIFDFPRYLSALDALSKAKICVLKSCKQLATLPH